MKRLMISGLVAFSMWQSLAYADDTDIYMRTRPEGTEPYLMLTFDYRNDMASTFCSGESACMEAAGGSGSQLWEELQIVVNNDGTSTFSANNIQALIAVLQTVFAKFNGIYVGLMMPNVNKGGSILREFKLFEEGDANNAKKQLTGILRSIPADGSMSGSNDFHKVLPKELHYEFWRYLNGKYVALGYETEGNFPGGGGIDTTVDYHLRVPPNPYEPGDPYHLPSSGDTAVVLKQGDNSTANDKYVSPFDQSGVAEADKLDYSCLRLYEVHATSGNDASGNTDNNLDSQISSDMSADAAGKGYAGMVGYMANNDLVNDTLAAGDQPLKSWYIQIGSAATAADEWAELMGTADQENYMEIDGKNSTLVDIQAILEAVFIEALSESSTFVSASVPVNVFNRVQTLDNFYIALFEANNSRRWPGNLKKLKMSDTDGDGKYDNIVDVSGTSAFSDEDGRILYEALTFWTDPDTLPPADSENSEIEGRDGRAVSRGGAGQKIPGFIGDDVGTTTGSGTRQLYVESSTAPSNGTAVSFDPLNADETTAQNLLADLGAIDSAEALDIIKWGRGLDVDDEDANPNTVNRPWILGDAIHSRPLALNYGATTGYSVENPNIRLFMGTNDGFFHIFEDSTASGVESGKELFAFIPRESLSVLKQLRDNTAGSPHPYGMDGEPVALVVDGDSDGTIESGDEVYVYTGMRRGGKSYYALDVSNPDAEPTLKLKITKTEGGDFDELGYTFSTPRVVKVQYEDNVIDALIFAGGYDMNKDNDDGKVANLGADSEGNAIYIVNARTGELIWKAVDGLDTNSNTAFYHNDLDHSIPSTITTLDSNSNGVVDRAYVGDSGGVVWRVDLPEGKDPDNLNHRRDNWEISQVADLGGDTEAGDRRFFHPPDVVQTRDDVGPYDGVLIESGDRANPLEIDDDNFFYLIKDRSITSGAPPANPILHSELADTTACVTGTESGTGYDCTTLDYTNGWKIELQKEGEKGLASPITIDGKVFFTTYGPVEIENSCEPTEGNGFLYVVNLKDGTAVYNNRGMDIGPGIPPQVTALGDSALIIPGAGMLEDPNDANGSKERDKLVDADGKSMYIIYWREPGIDKLER